MIAGIPKSDPRLPGPSGGGPPVAAGRRKLAGGVPRNLHLALKLGSSFWH
jgi:hypothetical protein